MTMAVEVPTLRTARKEHRCMYGTDCTIRPGEQYEEVVHPPWTLIGDEDGGTSPLGEWHTARYHRGCLYDAMYGTEAEHRAGEAQAGPGGTDGGM